MIVTDNSFTPPPNPIQPNPKRPSRNQQSQGRKVGIIKALLAKCEGEETKFLIRSLEGKLRIGLAEKTVSSIFLPPPLPLSSIRLS